MPRIYRRTDAGTRAWDSQDPRVPLECRRVLGLVRRHDTEPREICARLGLSEAALGDLLHDLEELALVQSMEASPDRTDLDFTGRFTASELHAASRPDLDFTGSMSVGSLRGTKKD